MPKYCLKDGTPVPGATTIAGLIDKPFLVKWANKLGKQGIDVTEYVEETARKGTLIHTIVESHVMHQEVNLEKYSDEEIIEAEKSYMKYLDWENMHNIIPIFSEQGFVSEIYKFCGVIDFYCILDGKYTIVDFKTSKSITHEHFLQVSSYVPLLIENNIKVDQILILNIGRDPDKQLEEQYMSLDSSNFYFEMFKNLLNVYYAKKSLGWK